MDAFGASSAVGSATDFGSTDWLSWSIALLAPASWTAGASLARFATEGVLLESWSSTNDNLDGDEMPAGEAIEDGLEERRSSLCVSTSGGGSCCVTTDGEADAARSWSSRLAPVMGDGEDLANGEKADFPGCVKGKVDGRGGC
jgi:hypothetical protein